MVVVISRVYEQQAETSCVPTLLIRRLLLILRDLRNSCPRTADVRFFELTDFRPRGEL